MGAKRYRLHIRIFKRNQCRHEFATGGEDKRLVLHVHSIISQRGGRLGHFKGFNTWITSVSMRTRLRSLIPTARMDTTGSGSSSTFLICVGAARGRDKSAAGTSARRPPGPDRVPGVST